jgi:hypothetical protein
LDLGGTDDPHGIIDRRWETKHGVAPDGSALWHVGYLGHRGKNDSSHDTLETPP